MVLKRLFSRPVRLSILSIALVLILLYVWRLHRAPMAARDIFQGVTYLCEAPPTTEQIAGLVHLIVVDLSAPGIDLYVSLPRPDDGGWNEKLRWPASEARSAGLAVAVNGTTFGDRHFLLPLPGNAARGAETTISEHIVSHIDPNSYLLWFDDHLRPHMELTKPPPLSVLMQARWGIGGQEVVVNNGHVHTSGQKRDARTMLGIDPVTSRLFIAVFESASYEAGADYLARHGAAYATFLDGGTSTTLYIANDAKNVRPGTFLNGWRPVANSFGIRALPLK